MNDIMAIVKSMIESVVCELKVLAKQLKMKQKNKGGFPGMLF